MRDLLAILPCHPHGAGHICIRRRGFNRDAGQHLQRSQFENARFAVSCVEFHPIHGDAG